MSTRRLVFLIAMAAIATPAVPAAQERTPTSVVRTGTLGETPLRESSGVAVSRQHVGVLWTHNDSGHGPYLYAITHAGAVIATFRLAGARAVDWEDIALAPCPAGRWPHRECLYVADTGDNLERRSNAVIYVVPEPDPRTAGTEVVRTEPALALRLRFVDGPRDVEALAVDSLGRGHLITKGRRGVILRYVIPSAAFEAESVAVAPADTLPITPFPLFGRWVTGAAFSPSGRRVAVRTHTELYFFTPSDGRWTLESEPCLIAGLEPQGEAVDFLDDQRLVLTSERGFGAEGVIHLVVCP
jgi:hypothetical protein